MLSKKKGNVDSDIILDCLVAITEGEISGQVVLVSGDGDFKRMVDYLIKKNRLLRIIFPNRNYSSLYNKLDNKDKFNLTLAKKQLEYIE